MADIALLVLAFALISSNALDTTCPSNIMPKFRTVKRVMLKPYVSASITRDPCFVFLLLKLTFSVI